MGTGDLPQSLRPERPLGSATLRMSDVARVAGVSSQTVSRALNNTGRISDQTRERILKVVAELGYRPNMAARTLVNRRSGIVGIVVSDTDQYAPRLTLRALESALRASDYGASLISYDRANPEHAQAAVWQLAAQGVEAIVLIGAWPFDFDAADRRRLGVPLLTIRGDVATATSVGIDQVAGAMTATELLLESGHQEVAYIAGPSDWLDASLRETGWRSALQAAALPVPPVEWVGDWTARSGYQIGLEVAARIKLGIHPNALFVANDQMAMGVCRAMLESNLSVPGEVDIVGFDDLPEAAYYSPPLTTVRQDLGALGRLAAATVLALIDNPNSPSVPTLLRPKVMVRESIASRRPGS